MIECTICSRLTPGFKGKCSRCLDSAKKNTYQERQQTACFVVDFLRRQEDEIEMAFVRWQARQSEEFCSHTPSGIEDLVGIVSPTCCTVPHSKHEKCANCGKWIPWHDFPLRRAAVNAASDVPGEQTADPEEAFAAEPYVRPIEPPIAHAHVVDLMQALKDSLRVASREAGRRDELAEERARRYVREDGTPK